MAGAKKTAAAQIGKIDAVGALACGRTLSDPEPVVLAHRPIKYHKIYNVGGVR